MASILLHCFRVDAVLFRCSVSRLMKWMLKWVVVYFVRYKMILMNFNNIKSLPYLLITIGYGFCLFILVDCCYYGCWLCCSLCSIHLLLVWCCWCFHRWFFDILLFIIIDNCCMSDYENNTSECVCVIESTANKQNETH